MRGKYRKSQSRRRSVKRGFKKGRKFHKRSTKPIRSYVVSRGGVRL